MYLKNYIIYICNINCIITFYIFCIYLFVLIFTNWFEYIYELFIYLILSYFCGNYFIIIII